MTLLDHVRRPRRTAYDLVSEESAAVVIRRYSSSFGLASRLLQEPVRSRVRNVYALVRVADEVVDNPDPSVPVAVRAQVLDALRADVHHSLRDGYSANLVVHAFASTARTCGVGGDLVDPFLDSMRADLDTRVHTRESFDRYVYGSAEVVGLMCLRVFLADERDPAELYDLLAPGARRLGAAFQKLNFLRDLTEDHDELGRSYFPDLDVDRFCDADRDEILDDVAADLAAAAEVVPLLPSSSRRAVHAAHATFAELAQRLRVTPADEIRARRVRVPGAVKVRIAAGALAGGRR